MKPPATIASGRLIKLVLPPGQEHLCGAHVRRRRYEVVARLSGTVLGWVHWVPPWHCWAFLPCEGADWSTVVWSADNLADLNGFIRHLESHLESPMSLAEGRARRGVR